MSDKKHHEEKIPSPKYKVGDAVTVSGKGRGEVTEVGVHTAAYFRDGGEQLYSVRLEPWGKVPLMRDGAHVHSETTFAGGATVREPVFHYENPEGPGEYRGHESEVLGCVPESSVRKGK